MWHLFIQLIPKSPLFSSMLLTLVSIWWIPPNHISNSSDAKHNSWPPWRWTYLWINLWGMSQQWHDTLDNFYNKNFSWSLELLPNLGVHSFCRLWGRFLLQATFFDLQMAPHCLCLFTLFSLSASFLCINFILLWGCHWHGLGTICKDLPLVWLLLL